MVNMHIKTDVPSFTYFKDKMEAPN